MHLLTLFSYAFIQMYLGRCYQVTECAKEKFCQYVVASLDLKGTSGNFCHLRRNIRWTCNASQMKIAS